MAQRSHARATTLCTSRSVGDPDLPDGARTVGLDELREVTSGALSRRQSLGRELQRALEVGTHLQPVPMAGRQRRRVRHPGVGPLVTICG